jgi:hypothetical protein
MRFLLEDDYSSVSLFWWAKHLQFLWVKSDATSIGHDTRPHVGSTVGRRHVVETVPSLVRCSFDDDYRLFRSNTSNASIETEGGHRQRCYSTVKRPHNTTPMTQRKRRDGGIERNKCFMGSDGLPGNSEDGFVKRVKLQ